MEDEASNEASEPNDGPNPVHVSAALMTLAGRGDGEIGTAHSVTASLVAKWKRSPGWESAMSAAMELYANDGVRCLAHATALQRRASDRSMHRRWAV